jgi:peptidoglycan/LPS O-acetylase OafA/YrhL
MIGKQPSPNGIASDGASPSADAPNLDILRALAVLLVVGDHSAQFFGAPRELVKPLGYAGVYLFFVHTSLVLMLSLKRQQARGPRRLALAFYVRRFFRIYPLSILAVSVVTLFAIPARRIVVPWTIDFEPARLGSVLSNLALTMNLTHHDPIIGQLWSLPLEVQMYVVLPLFYIVARRLGWPALVGAWVLAVVVSLEHKMIPGLWRVSLVHYVPHFLPGVLAFTLCGRRARLPAWLWLPVLIALIALYDLNPGVHAGWLMCLGVGLAIPVFEQVRTGTFARAAHLIAKYSYGIYLGHVLCLWIAFNAFSAPRGIQFFVWLVSLVVIPVVAFHCFEAPLMRLGARVAEMIARDRSVDCPPPSPLVDVHPLATHA